MTIANSQKNILIIADPNGAGKTTFATEFLLNEAGCRTFVNADMIAAGLNPFEPERSAMSAGRLMLRLIDDYVGTGESFAFETALSGRSYARMIPNWQVMGYWVRLCFLHLPTADMAVVRVRNRVREGGHNVEEEVVRRRFNAGWRNFHQIYRDIVNEWRLYDATGESPRLIEERVNDGQAE
ncbi:MAG: Zeta toxin family protein [Chloroflexi bacterium]|nr:Zeta toxin family protein [Chloroflexota bacterium]